MGDFTSYNGASVFTPHPKTVLEDGYIGIASGSPTGGTPSGAPNPYTLTFTSSTQPTGISTSPPPNTLLQQPTGVVITTGGLVTLTLKQPFPKLLFADLVTECPSGAGMYKTQMQSDTVGDNSASNTANPVLVWQVYNMTGSGPQASALPVSCGLRFCLVLQNASVY